MAARNGRYWRDFLHNLLAPVDAPSSETAYDGVSFVSASGRVEYRDGCFRDGSLDVDPLQLLALFEQLTRQAIQTATGRKEAENATPALRLSDCVFHVVSTSFSSVCAVTSGRSRGLVLEKLPFGVLAVAFSSPLRLETVFGRVDRACVALRR